MATVTVPVTVTGPPEAPVFHLTIPTGGRGPAGGVGPAGPPGELTKAAAAAFLVDKSSQPLNVWDFGARGDWVAGTGTGTDNLKPFNDAYAEAYKTGRSIYIPDGKYRFSGEWNIWRPSSSGKILNIFGQSRDNTWLVADFYGADKALIKNRDNLDESLRTSPTNLFNMQFRTVSRSGSNPVFIDIGGWGESIMDHIKFGPSNNTHFRASSLQNIRIMDTVSYYGGRNFLYKPTDGITFTVTVDGTITSSTNIFTATDVGMLFFLSPANDTTRIMYRIKSVTNGTTAVIDTVETPSIAATLPSKGNFDAAQATMTSGSNTLYSNGPCFTQDDVGRVLYIQGARAGAYGKSILRATITTVNSSNQVTLDKVAGNSIANKPFAMPVIDLYRGGGMPSTDVKWNNLHIEAYAGLGLGILEGLQWHVNDQKVHGEHDPVDARMSTGMIWVDNFGGVISGEFDGASHSRARLYACNQNDTLDVPFLSTRRVRNEVLFEAEEFTNPTGVVTIGTLVVYRHDTAGPAKFVRDGNVIGGKGNRLLYTSTVTMIGGTAGPRIYQAMNAFFTPEGRLLLGAVESTNEHAIELAGAGGRRVLFENSGTRRWSVGNASSLWSVIDESAGATRLQINATGDISPGAPSTQDLGSTLNKFRTVYADRTVIGGISFTTGVGSPEGKIYAPVGSEYVDTSGSVGAIKYGKKTGSQATGWVAIW